MTLAERVKKRRTELHWSQEELAKRMGYSSRSSINKIENGRPVSQKIIAKLADVLKVSEAYLLGINDNVKETFLNLIKVPIHSCISCGTGSWIDEQPDDYVGIPTYMTHSGSDYFANPAEGDSMMPDIRPGDLLIFEQTPEVPNGMIGSFSLNGQYFCKRFKKYQDGSCWLISDNPDYSPIPIGPDDDFRTLGLYKLKLSKEQ